MSPKPSINRVALETGVPADTAAQAWEAILSALESIPGGEHDSAIRQFPPGWRAAYTTFWLQCEVNNGGHHQFFWNTEGAWNAETQDDLEFIDAWPFVRIFIEARKIYDAHNYADEKAASGNSWEGFTAAYHEKRMGELDTEFYAQPKNIETFLGEFIRLHPELFTQ